MVPGLVEGREPLAQTWACVVLRPCRKRRDGTFRLDEITGWLIGHSEPISLCYPIQKRVSPSEMGQAVI